MHCRVGIFVRGLVLYTDEKYFMIRSDMSSPFLTISTSKCRDLEIVWERVL